MIINVLPGDATLEEFTAAGVEGDVVVCREALIDGDVRAKSLDEFWHLRERYLAGKYPTENASYAEDVVAELGKLIELPYGSQVNLWFEHELFCQVNLWFCLHLLRGTRAEVFRVAPSIRGEADKWNGFANLTSDEMRTCWSLRTILTSDDINFGHELWLAYQSGDMHRLLELTKDAPLTKFPYIDEVARAAADRDTRPAAVLKTIKQSGPHSFEEIFQEFSRIAGVYGYGDSQVRELLATI